MDVTLKEIGEKEFTERFRGYDVDEVKDFLDRIGHTMARLSNELRAERLRSEGLETDLAAARMEAEAAPPPPSPAAPSFVEEDHTDGEVEQASRTLMLAKRTAEAAIAEARAEANQLLVDAKARSEASVADARSESDRIVRDAQTQRDDMLRLAKEDADREFGSQKARFEEECRHLEERRRHTDEEVRALEDRVAEYRRDLEEVVARLRRILDDPAALRERTGPLHLSSDPFGAASLAHPQAPLRPAGSEPAPMAVRESVSAPDDVAPPRDGLDVAGDTRTEPGSRTQPAWQAEAGQTELDVDGPVTASAGFGQQPTRYEPDAVEAAGAADPWGPGSWSNVDADTGLFEPAELDEGIGFADGGPTASYEAVSPQGDRYLRELDEAVHGDDPQSDEAMSAFFENEEPARRRRGKRR